MERILTKKRFQIDILFLFLVLGAILGYNLALLSHSSTPVLISRYVPIKDIPLDPNIGVRFYSTNLSTFLMPVINFTSTRLPGFFGYYTTYNLTIFYHGDSFLYYISSIYPINATIASISFSHYGNMDTYKIEID